ncbi:MAG: flagellar biosynthetic protein FliR [Frankiales bacterium]|nr:flagellar biosynthetic protein FliR [Frankiales bacterium]
MDATTAALLPGGVDTLYAFLLVLARTSAWVVAAPVLSAKGISSVGRLAVALALALFVTPLLPPDAVPEGLAPFVFAALVQVAVGLALGTLTQLLFAAFEVAGTLLDTSGGFSAASIMDPLTGAPAAVFSRMFTVVFGALFFVTEAYQSVLGGFVQSFRVLPVDAVPHLSHSAAAALGSAATQVLASALQIGAPLLGILFLTDVALGLAGRLVPQAGTLGLALPVKGLVALSMAGMTLALLPQQLVPLVGPAVDLPFKVLQVSS